MKLQNEGVFQSLLDLVKERSHHAAPKAGTNVAADGLTKLAELAAECLADLSTDCARNCVADRLCCAAPCGLLTLFSFLSLSLRSGSSLSGLFLFCSLGSGNGSRFSHLDTAPLEELICGVRINRILIFGVENAALYCIITLGFCDGTHAALRRQNIDLLSDRRDTVCAEVGDDRFACAESKNRFVGIECRL